MNNPLIKYFKKNHPGGFPALELYDYSQCHTYEPMAKVMRKYFEFGLGDLINDLIVHKSLPFYKKWSKGHKEMEAVLIRMINVMIQWQQDDRFDKVEKEVITTNEVKETPKETTRDAIVEMILINNSTDKEYVIKSENECGLSWNYIGKEQGNYELLVINQNKSLDKQKWISVGRFTNFSILKTVWKTFDIEPDAKLKEGIGF